MCVRRAKRYRGTRKHAARFEKVSLHQSGGVLGLSASRALHHHADRRQVTRLENEAVLDRVAARLKARPWVLDRRREVVEHPFGSIKQWMYQGAFLTKGLEKVRAEFSLTALAYNLRRAINIVGVEGLMAAVRA